MKLIYLQGEMTTCGCHLNYTLIYNTSISLEVNSLESLQKTGVLFIGKNKSAKCFLRALPNIFFMIIFK